MKLENYRHYLQREFEKRRVRNPGYSLRAYARDLKTSPSRLSESINGKRGISLDLAKQMVKGLGLEGIDADIFLLSVEAEHSRSEKQKKQSLEKLKIELARSDAPQKTFTVVDWIAEALLKMNEREPVADNIDAAAQKLGVPKFMATESMRFLTRLGFISGAKNFKTYLQERGKDRKLNVDYTQILDQAHKAYVGNVSEGDFTHQAYLLEKKDLAKAARIMRDALDEVRKLESKAKSAKVVFISNQIFRAEKEGK